MEAVDWKPTHDKIKKTASELNNKYPNAEFSEGDCGVFALYLVKLFGKGSVSEVLTSEEPERALHYLYQLDHNYYDERGAIDENELKDGYSFYDRDSIEIKDGLTAKDAKEILSRTNPKLKPAQIKELLG